MTANARRFIGLWLCLDGVEQQALYELVEHRVRCRAAVQIGGTDV